MKPKLLLTSIAAAILTPLSANAASAVITSTDDARRAAQAMHASGQTAQIERMLSTITPRSTDEARALAGLRINFAAPGAAEAPLASIPTSTDDARKAHARRVVFSSLVGSFDIVETIS